MNPVDVDDSEITQLKSKTDEVPETLNEFQPQQQQQQQLLIKAKNGSIRGKRNNVRQTINNYIRLVQSSLNNEIGQRNFIEEEQNRCILYVTTLAIIRKTLSDSKGLQSILKNHFIQFELRDVYINDQYRQELIERLNGKLIIPSLFIDGQFIGSFTQIEKLNETGQLISLLQRFKRCTIDSSSSSSSSVAAAATTKNNGVIDGQQISNINGQHDDDHNQKQQNRQQQQQQQQRLLIEPDCIRCGNRQFINCIRCHGSGRFIVHHFPGCSVGLKCTYCNRSGMIRCPDCHVIIDC
ncbi:glutaredoxin domain-containing cysteine-rich protein [Dermatophagoides farinae]|nr:glutaredoxin domain-containing cysteine-rich protein [Dermatophagoides farinae]